MLELLQNFVQDFSEQYLQAKIQENSFEFSDIAHFAIEILEENPDIRKLYQDKYHEVMVDEYQDNNHTQERMLNCYQMVIIVLWWRYHNRFIVRQADPQIFNQNSKIFRKILSMEN